MTAQSLPNDPEIVRAWRFKIKCAEECLEQNDLDGALRNAKRAAALTSKMTEIKYLTRTAKLLLMLSDWHTLAAVTSRIERMRQPEGPPEWDGSTLPSGTLVITERNDEHIARPIRFARLIPLAASRVQRCIVLAEPRLVPLFRRTFPDVEIRAIGDDDEAVTSGVDAVAGYQTLIKCLAPDDDAIRAGYIPLAPDAALVRSLRRRYEGRPLIGISWSSNNSKKNLPSVANWGEFMRTFDATYVSLQYGDVGEDIAMFKATNGIKIIHDKTIDALRDMDGHAAQVAAMDAVVTISNTTAHMAGALAVRTFLTVEVSRKLDLIWPMKADGVSWYPSLTITRKAGRDWSEVLSEMQMRLASYFAQERN